MRKVLRGYANDGDGNLILIGTMARNSANLIMHRTALAKR